MDGSVLHHKVAAFRVIPYFARHKLILPDGVLKIIDVSKAGLEKIESAVDNAEVPDKGLWVRRC